MKNLLGACRLLLELYTDDTDDPLTVDPEWRERVLASCRAAIAEAEKPTSPEGPQTDREWRVWEDGRHQGHREAARTAARIVDRDHEARVDADGIIDNLLHALGVTGATDG